MRFRWILPALVCLLCVNAVAQDEFPQIGMIDFYGRRSVSEAQVRRALRIKVGDAAPDSPFEAQRRLEAVRGVVRARTDRRAAGRSRMSR